MNYENVASFSQVTSLLLFLALFLAVLAYAFWPGAAAASIRRRRRRSISRGSERQARAFQARG